MKILGTEIEFSFTNGDDVKRLEDNYGKVIEVTQSFKGDEKLSEVLNKTCEVIDNFFDETFGNGTARKIFNKNDLKDRIQALKEVRIAKEDQEKDYDDLIKAFTEQTAIADSKYSKDRAKR